MQLFMFFFDFLFISKSFCHYLNHFLYLIKETRFQLQTLPGKSRYMILNLFQAVFYRDFRVFKPDCALRNIASMDWRPSMPTAEVVALTVPILSISVRFSNFWQQRCWNLVNVQPIICCKSFPLSGNAHTFIILIPNVSYICQIFLVYQLQLHLEVQFCFLEIFYSLFIYQRKWYRCINLVQMRQVNFFD